VIRPLAYVDERDIVAYSEWQQFPIIPCNLCGSQENLQRKQVGNMLRDWQRKFPGRLDNMLHALQNVVPSHLMDTKLHDFKSLQANGLAHPEGDKGFDHESFESTDEPCSSDESAPVRDAVPQVIRFV
jgi:tRNA 2-thiocytidine biosynthesis protein TtcA